MLKYSKANAKTESLGKVEALQPYLAGNRKIYSLDLLSGWSCPFADKCLSKVHIVDGKRKLEDGPNTEFRCFSASQEVVYTNTYKARKHNYDLLRASATEWGMFPLLRDALPKNAGIVRIHVAGDFFNQQYFDAWLAMAKAYPETLFYAYTKSLGFWIKRREQVNKVPNFVLTASYGGRLDHEIGKRRMRSAKVVYSEAEAASLGLEIDHDDSHAADPSKRKQSFALLIHGVQPAGSDAAEALRDLKGKGSYSRKGGTMKV